MDNKLLKKFMEYGVGSIITLLIGFISSPIITRLITPEQNGKFSMFSTLGNLLLVIMMIGIDQSFVRFFYDEVEENRYKLLRLCVKIPIVIGIFVGVVICIFYRPITNYMVEQESIYIAIVFVIFVILNIIFRFASLQIRMSQKAKLFSLINVIQKISNLILVIGIFGVLGNDYNVLILASIFSIGITTVIAMLCERKVWFEKINEKNLKVEKKEIIKYGIPLVFSMAITWIFQSSDRIALKEFVGYTELGIYNGAMTIIVLLNAVQSTFTTFWTPVAFETYANHPENIKFFKTVNEIVSFVMLMIGLGLIAAKDVIVLLLGEEYRQAVFIFPFLVFMPIMYTISETTVIGINFKKNPKDHIKVALIAATINIMGNILLVPRLGATGAAISTGIAYIIFFGARTYFSNKYYKVDFRIKKFMIATSLVYLLAIYSSFNKFNLTILISTIIIGGIIITLYKEVLSEIISKFKGRG